MILFAPEELFKSQQGAAATLYARDFFRYCARLVGPKGGLGSFRICPYRLVMTKTREIIAQLRSRPKTSSKRKWVASAIVILVAAPLAIVGTAAPANAWVCASNGAPSSTVSYGNPWAAALSPSSTSGFSCSAHSGWDWALNWSSYAVRAVKDGTMVKRGNEPSCHGIYLVETGGDGVEIAYAHLADDSALVSGSASVSKGGIIASSSNSGECGDAEGNGIHWHLSAARNWDLSVTNGWTSSATTMFNPCTFLNANGASLPGC